MLRLIIGRAGAGKTAAVIEEIRQAAAEGRGGRILLVPEQYSHEAERELCRKCGDTLSLYGEVFSFTGLARRVMQQQGGGAVRFLDKGGRLLCMALALNDVGSRLRVYTAARQKSELQAMLLSALDELKTACVTPEKLEQAARGCEGALADKLHDLALISAAYDAVVANGRADPADRLSILARQIGESDFGPEQHVYVDGFTDFTYQELAVLSALLRKNVEMTVCLTVDAPDSNNEVFSLSRQSLRRLMAGRWSCGPWSGRGSPPPWSFSPRRCSATQVPPGPAARRRSACFPPRASAPSAKTPRRRCCAWCGRRAAAGGISPWRSAALRTTGAPWRACSGTTGSPSSPPGGRS